MINKIRIRTKLLLVLLLTGLSLAAAIGAATSILHQRMLADRIAKLRAVVEMAHEQAQTLDAQVKSGKLTLDDAMARFKDMGRGMWFDNHVAYVGIVSYDGIWFMNAAVPKIEGTRGNTMPDGRYISQTSVDAVKNSEEGLASYDYPKPGATEALPKMTFVKKFAPWKLLITAGVWTDDLEADFHATLYRLAGAGLVLLLITGGLILGLSRNITRSLSGLRDKMVRLVDGDLSVDIDEARRSDEIGDMAKAVQVFKNNAVAMQALQAEQKELGAQAEQQKKQAMREMADGFEARIGGIVGAVSGAAAAMQSTAKSMSVNAESTQQRTSAVAAGAEESTVNVQTVAAASEELAASIAEIGRQVTQASIVARKANEESEKTNVSVAGLADAAQKIGEVVAFITQIASQTNLLALNATIEAARAGEAGRGFAVVASEVKSLATQTSKATDDIRSQIETIQAETADAVAAIKRISMTIVEVNNISTTIAASMDQQGAATQEITRNVQEAADSAKHVSENINGVSEAVEATGHAASGLLGEADKLAQQARTLQAEVGDFLATVRAA
ncbi:methyl-accepting chemotaxis protein [Nitrobacteraceae bacterium AZCC 2146]